MTEPAVVIAGGGPTGLTLVGELSVSGVDVAIVERRATQDLIGWCAGGLHSGTIEILRSTLRHHAAGRSRSVDRRICGLGGRPKPQWGSLTR
jgi:2-polyprenyl-6-methoxyphenol hydroxylase-like FAD-dependent oxidoreductase